MNIPIEYVEAQYDVEVFIDTPTNRDYISLIRCFGEEDDKYFGDYS